MKLLLRKDIPKLGLCGDIVEVSAGYARNYLLPHHLAFEPTKANLKAIEEDKKIAAAERERRHAFLSEMAGRLAGVEVTISAACTPDGHLYGSVGPREISSALMDEGHSIHPDQVKMSHNIKEVGTSDVPVVLSDEIKAEVKVWVVAEKSLDDYEDEEPVGDEMTGEGETEVSDVGDDSAAVGPESPAADSGDETN